eukprot:6467500-Lingulodinium_polyedra.AAC.1
METAAATRRPTTVLETPSQVARTAAVGWRPPRLPARPDGAVTSLPPGRARRARRSLRCPP